MDPTEVGVRFARHNFENLQSLIRFADAKAGALAAFLFVLVATGSSLAQKAFDKLHFNCSWCVLVGAVLYVSWAVFFIVAIVVVLRLLLAVVLPRFAANYSNVNHTGNLIYWSHIALRRNNEEYANDVASLDASGELRNLTDQVYELAKIAEVKMNALVGVRFLLICTTIGWLVASLSSMLAILSDGGSKL